MQIAKDAACKLTEEGEVEITCADVQVEAVLLPLARNDGAMHQSPVLGYGTFHVCIECDGSFLLSPVCIKVHVPKVGTVEGEVFYLQESIGKRLFHYRCGIDASRYTAVEFDFMEVHKVHDVGDIDVGKFGFQRV